MKFTIEPQMLSSILATVVKAVPVKPNEPILSNFLLEVKSDTLRVTATDGEIALRGLVKPDSVEADGSTTVPAKLLMDLVRTLPAGPAVFSLNENTLNISWATGNSNLPVFNPQDFVKIEVPAKAGAKQLSVTTDAIVKSLTKTLFAASHDVTNKKLLCGVYFDAEPGVVNMVATDTSKLVISTITSEEKANEPGSFILPSRSATILKSVLPKEQTLTIVYDEKNVRFAFGAVEMTARTIVGKYPNYKSVIPTGNDNILTVPCERLQDVLLRMKVVAEKTHSLVKAKLEFNCIDLTAEDLGMSTNGNEKIECDYDGSELTISLRSEDIVDILANVESEKVNIKFRDAVHAILIEPVGEENKPEPYKAIAMPYRVK